MTEDSCQVTIINEERLAAAKEQMPAEDLLCELAETFKLLGDPTRMKILQALAITELCVCDLAAVCGASESAVSHQLRILRNLKIVRFRREGKSVFYRLDDDHVKSLISQSLQHVKE